MIILHSAHTSEWLYLPHTGCKTSHKKYVKKCIKPIKAQFSLHSRQLCHYLFIQVWRWKMLTEAGNISLHLQWMKYKEECRKKSKSRMKRSWQKCMRLFICTSKLVFDSFFSSSYLFILLLFTSICPSLEELLLLIPV